MTCVGEETSQDVTCCRLFDGKLSVRVNGVEVSVLPSRMDIRAEDMERAFCAVILACSDQDMKDAVDDAVNDACVAAVKELSKW